jgi:alkylation response protein AidB-like acyl-CoA dehydrogenase
MHVTFTAAEIEFRDEVRAFLHEGIPQDIRRKQRESVPLDREDSVRFQKLLADKGWAAVNWPVEYGGTAGQKVGQEAVQLHGAMGVSWDLDIAHYFKRLTAIGQMFGNADWHLDKLAA